ncbi:MAG: hypothetical protein AMJ78_04900 [Omnitrophica WOR_2 bacterium SM23_29]|nr:MAG: hypothetical protein AMJ78_04900 [Omnitrophica WOR_2 bacterium SM23_29]
MKKATYLIFIAFLIVVLTSCTKEKSKKEVLVTIDNYSLYKEDFLSEARLYPPAYREVLTKEQILDDLIQKKLLLLEAQRQGLDKDPAFMKMVERFWEQSLLRSLLEKKSKEILSSIQAPEEERNQKATQMMQRWMNELKKSAKIRINKGALDRIELK